MKKQLTRSGKKLSEKNFWDEMKRRNTEMQTGKAKTYTWEEVQQLAKESLKKARMRLNN